jgi:uncharacterized delta-60 repeat protein
MKFLLSAFVFFFFVLFGNAQNGSLDLLFNPEDRGYSYGDGLEYKITCSAIQADGKIVIGGDFTKIDSTTSRGIVRLDSLGDIDTSFHTGLGFNSSAMMPNVVVVKAMADGKILVGGNFTSYNGITAGGLVRLNSDGSLDPSFHLLPQALGILVNDIELLPSGKILLVGGFSGYDGTPTKNMVVINYDGTIDPGFDTNLGSSDEIYLVESHPDNKLLLYGTFNEFNGEVANKLVRLFSDFTTDTTFNVGLGPNSLGSDYGSRVRINPDSSIYFFSASGWFTSFNGYVPPQQIVKLHSDGSIDSSFSFNNFSSAYVQNILNLPNNDQIFVGEYNYQGNYLNTFKLLANGTFDFSYNSAYANLFTADVSLLDENNNLLYFSFNTSNDNKPLLRFNNTGALDTSFFKSCGANSRIQGTILQSDGKIVLHGDQRLYEGNPAHKIFRILSDGTIDTSFYRYTENEINRIYNITQLNDNKFLLHAIFWDDFDRPFRRLLSNGSIDTSFHTLVTTPSNTVGSQLQSDNKIIVWGGFTSYGGTTVNRIMRINEDASLDNSFVSGTGLNLAISQVLVQPDQKILLLNGGTFTYNGTTCNGAARLNADGSIDNSFSIGSGFNGNITCAIVLNNKIIIGGNFTTYNGSSVKRLVRLNMNGTIDNTFAIGTGFDDYIRCLSPQSDQKILVGGDFNSYNGNNYNGIIRLNDDGSADLDIQFGNGFPEGGVLSINTLQNQKILAAGSFTHYDGTGRNRLALLNNCIIDIDTSTVTACGSYNWSVNNQTYTSSGIYTDTLTSNFGCDSILTLNLTVIPIVPLEVNTFSQPSDANSCVGALAVSSSGNNDFNSSIDAATPINNSGYFLAQNLCIGVHSLFTSDACNDTLTLPFVIPVDSNYIFNNPFIDSIAVDSLGATIENCIIYYNSIDTAYIDSIFANGNEVTVIWNIVDSSGSNYDTSSYVFNNGNGVYYVQLSIFCPTKALGDYFTVTEAVYFNNGNLSTDDLTHLNDHNIALYPNPTDDLVIIYFKESYADLAIYDIHGKCILTRSIISGDFVSLLPYQTGLYLFVIRTDSKQFTQRIVKK